jgi:Na+/H+ antiporter NhaD/arsenite permease-like protein
MFVYAGMILGKYPGLAIDRTGIALVGAIFLVAAGRLDTAQAWAALDVPTLALLLGLMVVSAQFRLGGFYTQLARRIAAAEARPETMLLLLILAAGALSALLVNDVICLAMTPVLVEGCARRRLNPFPFLLGLACASNVGSAATLIGNPQNMLIGEVLSLSFARYLVHDAAVPSLLGLIAVWAVIVFQYRGRWERETVLPAVETPAYNSWQTSKGAVILSGLVAGFLFSPWPREVLALAGAGVLLASRRNSSRFILGLVDWQLLILFMGLFVLNQAVRDSGLLEMVRAGLASSGIDLHHPAWLFLVTIVLSNLVSNVPATMLLLPFSTHPLAGPILALVSTMAGNLFIVGSIANIIVVDQANRFGVHISWRDHAKTGVPVTLLTLGLAGLWLWVRTMI